MLVVYEIECNELYFQFLVPICEIDDHLYSIELVHFFENSVRINLKQDQRDVT